VRNITFSNIKGHGGSFGQLAGNPGQSSISGISFENIDVQLENPKLAVDSGIDVAMKNVVVNGKPYEQ
jgi:hypothetical protein